MRYILLFVLITSINFAYADEYKCVTSNQDKNEHNLYIDINYSLSNSSDIYKCTDYWMQGNSINTLGGDDKVYISKNTGSDKLIINLGDGNDSFYHTFHDIQLMNTLIDGGNGYDKIYLKNLNKEKLFINGNCNNKCDIRYNGNYERLLGNITLKNIEEIVLDDGNIKFNNSNTNNIDDNSLNNNTGDNDNIENNDSNINNNQINLSNYNYLIPAYWWSYDLNKKLENINNAIVIINPSNGDFSRNEDIFNDMLTKVKTNNNLAVGYIYTLYGKRNLNDVKKRIDTWIKEYPGINGFFFDEVSSSQSDLNFYKEIYDYVKLKNKNFIVILNPGTTPDEGYMNISDNIVVYENKCGDYKDYIKPNWLKNYKDYRFSYLGHTCKVSEINNLSINYKSYIQYFTGDGSDGNPWDSFSDYILSNTIKSEEIKIESNNINIDSIFKVAYDLGKFHNILDSSKLTYPDSHTKVVNYGDFSGYISDFFYADEEGNMTFVLDKKSGDLKIRNELRQGVNGVDTGWKINADNIHHLYAEIKLQELSKSLEYTFLQIHSEVNPLLRMVVDKDKNGIQNHIWAVVRINTNTSGTRTERYDLGKVTNDFENFDIYVGNNNLTIKKNGNIYVNKDILYWPETKNYFKAGIYDSKDSKGSWNIVVKFKELFTNTTTNTNTTTSVNKTVDINTLDDKINKFLLKIKNQSSSDKNYRKRLILLNGKINNIRYKYTNNSYIIEILDYLSDMIKSEVKNIK